MDGIRVERVKKPSSLPRHDGGRQEERAAAAGRLGRLGVLCMVMVVVVAVAAVEADAGEHPVPRPLVRCRLRRVRRGWGRCVLGGKGGGEGGV